MNIRFAILIALATLSLPRTGSAQVLLSNVFSQTSGLGTTRTTSGDNNFHSLWSVTPSVNSTTPGDWFAHYNINIPSLPTNSAARWSGGYLTLLSITNLPPLWQLSFDISLPTVEAFEVSFRFVNSTPGFPPAMTTFITYTLTPPATGWQHLTINQSTPSTITQRFAGSLPNGALSIALLSHNPLGQPATISHVGTHAFDLDNIILVVPEPSALALFGLAAIPLFRKIRQR